MQSTALSLGFTKHKIIWEGRLEMNFINLLEEEILFLVVLLFSSPSKANEKLSQCL